MAVNRDALAAKRLDSWKEIAAFFGRAERTVKRWEAERGLPVHRVPGSGRGAVFAYSDELAAWLKGRSQELDADETSSGEITESVLTPSGATPSDAAVSSPTPALNKSGLAPARVAAWLVPLLLAASLVALSSMGNRGAHFKALASRHAPNPEAQDLYLKGRYYWDRRTPEDLTKAIDYFTQAIVKDPSDAQAYVGLADCYNLLREFGAMPPMEAYPRALAAAQRAVELDDTSAEAHTSLAFATFWWSWHAATAEREFKRSLELNPGFVRGHHWYATYLLALHRHAEALEQIEQAQRLEPSSTAILADKGFLLWCAGRHNEGLTLLKQLAGAEPSLSSTHAYLGAIYWEKKDYAHALLERRRLAELRSDPTGLANVDVEEKAFAAGGLEGLLQSRLPLQKKLVDRGSGSSYDLAATYLALDKKQDALASLKIALERREGSMLSDPPALSALDNNPEYQDLLAQRNDLLAQ